MESKRKPKKPVVKTTAITASNKVDSMVDVIITKHAFNMAYTVGKNYKVTSEEAKKLKELGLID